MPSRRVPDSLSQLGEFGLIERFKRRAGRPPLPIWRGVGEDDCAIIRTGQGNHLLLTTDLLAEGIHFDLDLTDMADVGYKAAVSNLSDIAAMGGLPSHILVALAIPPRHSVAEIDQLFKGIVRASRRYGVPIVGGDTSASRTGLFICITATGETDGARPLTRGGARIGDLLYVSGTLGDSRAGLEILRGTRARAPGRGNAESRRHRQFLIGRHLRPIARIKEGRFLAERGLATAALDISDGLSGDLWHLCRQSGVGAEIEAASVPLSASFRWYASAHRLEPVQLALEGGEDYELLFTVPAREMARFAQLARRARLRFTRIGVIRPKSHGVLVRSHSGKPRQLKPFSYQHFQDRTVRRRRTRNP